MSAHALAEDGLYGVMAEFQTPGDLVAAARKTREAGYKVFDAYSPLPLHELDDAMDLHDNRVGWITLIGGLLGCTGGFSLCYWVSNIAYPLNIGGKPMNSIPMWIPITFECTILLAGLSCAISMILLNGLPEPYHPVFNWDRFANASRSGFFLCIESRDRKFELNETTKFLRSLNPEEIAEIAQ